MTERWEPIAEVLRRRTRRGVQAGTLQPGDRLPSARTLARELDVDPRVVVAAYRDLEREGLVELRARGGVYLRGQPGQGGDLPSPNMEWLAGIFTEAISREVPLPELPIWLHRVVTTLRLRATVIASTTDQAQGLCRELRDDFGLETSGVLVAALNGNGQDLPLDVRRADILVTTEAHGGTVRALAASLGRPCVVTTVRPDLIGGEWRLLLRRPVYVVVEDERFAALLTRFFASTPGHENLRLLVLGRDDPTTIPDGAPTYITRSARERLGETRVPGRILPAARTLSAESAREIVEILVRANLRALGAQGD